MTLQTILIKDYKVKYKIVIYQKGCICPIYIYAQYTKGYDE